MDGRQFAFDVHKTFHEASAAYAAQLDAYLAAVHAAPVWAISREARLAKAPLRAGMRVLDAGCGSGHDLAWMSSAVCAEGRIVGVDLNGDLIALARDRAGARDLNVDLRVGDLHKLPFADATFDA